MGYSSLRLGLVDHLRRSIRDERLLRAMASIPRELFVPKEYQQSAYDDRPLPIGMGQTVSAPHMVAIMNDALELQVGHRVLEVGGGCGWHAAVISEMVAPKDRPISERGHVYTMEIVEKLAQLARENILRNGFGDRVTVVHKDGSLGYPKESPYDRVLVTAAAPEVPPPLIEA